MSDAAGEAYGYDEGVVSGGLPRIVGLVAGLAHESSKKIEQNVPRRQAGGGTVLPCHLVEFKCL